MKACLFQKMGSTRAEHDPDIVSYWMARAKKQIILRSDGILALEVT
jgi:hypothetical protein